MLARADVGIAMGGLGSDAAIEAADVVLMTDEPSKFAAVMKIARKTIGIANQNIVFALGVKFLVLICNREMRRRKISGAFLLLFSNLCFFYAVTFGCFTRMARIAFRIAMTETPTSANTAAHIFQTTHLWNGAATLPGACRLKNNKLPFRPSGWILWLLCHCDECVCNIAAAVDMR